MTKTKRAWVFEQRKNRRIVIQPELCSGCRTCELVCALYHEGESNPSLSRIHVKRDFFEAEYIPVTCLQCKYPPCYYACPVDGALIIDKNTGSKVIIEEKCTGCGTCARICPYNEKDKIIRYNPQKTKCFKCDLCGGNPQCVKACRWMALKYE